MANFRFVFAALVDVVVKFEPSLPAAISSTGVAGAHAAPFQVKVCPLVAPVVVPKGDPLIFSTTVAPRLPVTSPVEVMVSASAATPFTVLSSWLVPFCVRVLLFTRFTDEPVTPFTVVVSVLAALVLLMLLMIDAFPETPFTSEVSVFAALLSVCVTEPAGTAAGTHAEPFQVSTWPLLAPVVVPSGEPLIFATTVAPRLPVTSPVVLAVSAELAIPFTVLTNWFVPFCVKVLLLIRFTDEPATPFTVVVNVFAELVLLTVFTEGAVTDTPFTTEVIVLTGLLKVCVVVEGAADAGTQAVPFQLST